jgi:DNA-binding winged helix-turn-helix (wHTH) protein
MFDGKRLMRLQFGKCVLDRETRELFRAGRLVHTPPKALRLLELLLDVRPRALTKDEIHKAIWPNTFVSDATLTSLVADLRTALGDDARTPHLVRTLHGFGYAFSADVTEGEVQPRKPGEDCSFRILYGDREVSLSNGDNVLGRSPDVAIFVDDVAASRQHATIRINENGATLEDLGSKNGTNLNGARIDRPMSLADGDRVVIGSTTFVFRAFEALATTRTLNGPTGPS